MNQKGRIVKIYRAIRPFLLLCFAELKGTLPRLLFKDPAEISLVVIPYRFPDLPDGQFRVMEQHALCM